MPLHKWLHVWNCWWQPWLEAAVISVQSLCQSHVTINLGISTECRQVRRMHANVAPRAIQSPNVKNIISYPVWPYGRFSLEAPKPLLQMLQRLLSGQIRLRVIRLRPPRNYAGARLTTSNFTKSPTHENRLRHFCCGCAYTEVAGSIGSKCQMSALVLVVICQATDAVDLLVTRDIIRYPTSFFPTYNLVLNVRSIKDHTMFARVLLHCSRSYYDARWPLGLLTRSESGQIIVSNFNVVRFQNAYIGIISDPNPLKNSNKLQSLLTAYTLMCLWPIKNTCIFGCDRISGILQNYSLLNMNYCSLSLSWSAHSTKAQFRGVMRMIAVLYWVVPMAWTASAV